MTTILLGPQRFSMTLGPVVRSLAATGALSDGPLAVVTAGWQEREPDDAELRDALNGHQVVNLGLWRRAAGLLAADDDLRRVVVDHRAREEELRAFYGIRLQAAWDAAFAVRRRTSRTVIGEAADRSALQALRDVDDWYAYEVARLYETTQASPVRTAHEGLAAERAEVARLIEDSAAVCIAGGHVGVLMNCLRALAIALPAQLPVIAWSAGAMAVGDPVLLFHDFAPHGVTAPELHDRGLARLPGVIALPHARRRLRLDDHGRLAVLAQRFPRHRLLPLDDGTIVRFDGCDERGGDLPAGTRYVRDDGTIATWEAP